MRVNPNSDASAVTATPSRAAALAPGFGQDQLALTATESLNLSLEQTPEARPDKVAEAKALIQDGTYPPAVIIRKISALLAVHIDPKNNFE